jgi:hypothetical protein
MYRKERGRIDLGEIREWHLVAMFISLLFVTPRRPPWDVSPLSEVWRENESLRRECI